MTDKQLEIKIPFGIRLGVGCFFALVIAWALMMFGLVGTIIYVLITFAGSL